MGAWSIGTIVSIAFHIVSCVLSLVCLSILSLVLGVPRSRLTRKLDDETERRGSLLPPAHRERITKHLPDGWFERGCG